MAEPRRTCPARAEPRRTRHARAEPRRTRHARAAQKSQRSRLNWRLLKARQADLGALLPNVEDGYRLVASPSKNELSTMYAIVEENMRGQYESSDWGWNSEAKKAELESSLARYVIARRGDTIAGFAHFRFEFDDDEDAERAVLYVYELQTQLNFRGLGVGSKCMAIVEQVAAALNLDALLLTVFKSNTAAVRFYTDKLRYTVDEDDPSHHGDRDCCYYILCKKPSSSDFPKKRSRRAKRRLPEIGESRILGPTRPSLKRKTRIRTHVEP